MQSESYRLPKLKSNAQGVPKEKIILINEGWIVFATETHFQFRVHLIPLATDLTRICTRMQSTKRPKRHKSKRNWKLREIFPIIFVALNGCSIGGSPESSYGYSNRTLAGIEIFMQVRFPGAWDGRIGTVYRAYPAVITYQTWPQQKPLHQFDIEET